MKISQRIKELKGTASELFENAAYDELVSIVGEDGALSAISAKLEERGLSTDDWTTYRRVRGVMHTNPIKIGEIVKEIDRLSKEALGFEA